MTDPRRVCVYCASSRQADAIYQETAASLGRILAERSVTLVYGGGAVGSMGALANAALDAGGKVVGILPRFMDELEWGHPGVTELRIVDSIHTRKHQMIAEVDAVVALPGGSGTFEELFEAITWKRLGLYLNPIVIVNVRNYFDPCLELLERSIEERFMNEKHRALWQVADGPEDVLTAIREAPPWGHTDRGFAVP